MTRTIAIRNWSKYQHYKDRDPPWVKLYRDLLTAESWVLGTDASRLVQLASMMLAARYQNATPLNYDLFRKVASLDLSASAFDSAIAHLAKAKFLDIQEDETECKQGASSVIATCTSETETETETEQRQIQRAARNCPDSFVVTEALRSWASTECPGIDLERETAMFRDYTFASAKTDWTKTWRNWMRKAKPANGRNLTKFEQSMKALDAWGPHESGTDETPVAIAGPNVRAQVR